MKQFDDFYYRGYTIDGDNQWIYVKYLFEIPGLSAFTPGWKFPKGRQDAGRLMEDAIFKELVFSLGMVELISYWKLTCAHFVHVEAGALLPEQICWWKDLYYYGMGEFFYTNKIDADKDAFMEITASGEPVTGSACPVKMNERCLVPVGGGKDSAVSIELLRRAGKDICAYIINPRGATTNTVKAAGLPENQVLKTERTLDKRMIELNARGFLNGHTPYSAIVAFSSTITAYLHGLHYITLSNEASANESTVKGMDVNHQYSKSFRFEKAFHEYELRYIGSGTYYFSLLRPLSEFQIARFFAQCTAYHDIFRSCNAGSKEDKWCGHCPKCLFVFLILSPFLEHRRMIEIFGCDMVNDASLIPVFDQLVGVVDEKPFECVGSRDEVKAACCMVIDRYRKEGKKLPVLYEHYVSLGLYEKADWEQLFFTYYEEDNLLEEEFARIVRSNCCGRD